MTGLLFFRLQFWHGLIFWYDVLEVAAYTVFFMVNGFYRFQQVMV